MGKLDKIKEKEKELTPRAALTLSALVMFSKSLDVETVNLDMGLHGQADLTSIVMRIARGSINDMYIALELFRENFDIEGKGDDKLIEMVAEKLNKKQQTSALINLIDIAMADGVLEERERVFLEKIIDRFSVSQEVIDDIIDISNLKNDLSIFD